jgi:murein DD-endopeptidase MepM/ murein hydrolase activator NlpD
MVVRVTDNQVEQRGFTGARFQAADFGEGRSIAQGAQQFARGLDEATANFDKIGQMHDEAVVKNADAEDLKAIMEIRAEAMSSQGLEAPAAIKAAQEKIEDIRRQREASFSNQRQRALYNDVFKARDLQIAEQFANHGIKQIKEAEKTAALSRAESYIDLAVDTYGDPAFDANLETALSEVAVINRGMPAEVIDRERAEVKSKILARVVSGMLTSPDNAQEAELALEKHAPDILPDDEEKLRKTLNPILEEDQTEVDAGRAWSASVTPEGEEDPLGPLPASTEKPVSPADPLRGKGRVTNSAAQHRARGSGNALDIAAPEGTPIYPPMSGKVLGKPFWTDRGGWQVIIEHPNGYVTGYAHMRSRPPLEAGQAVDSSTVIGSVGSTGRSTGPHLHYTARRGKGGPKVDPSVLDWGSAKVNPEKVEWKEGPLQRYEPQENQLGRALSRLHDIATRENWSPRRYNRAVDRVRQQAGVQEQIFNQNQEKLAEAAWDAVADLGDGLTSVSQIPGFADLKPGQRISIQNIIKSNKAPKEGDEAGSDAYFHYYDMSMNPATRVAFTRDSSFMSDPRLTNGERKSLRARQWEIRNDQDGTFAAKMDEATSMTNRFLPKSDGFTDEQRTRFGDAYMHRVSEYQKGRQAPLTDREKLDIARGLAVPIVRFSRTPQGEERVKGKSLLFEYQGPGRERAEVDFEKVYSTIPADTHDRIRAELKRQGKRHSKQDIVRAYIEQARF